MSSSPDRAAHGRTPFFSRLRVRLLALVLLAILPAPGLVLYTGLEQREAARLDAEASARRIVKLAASSQKQHFEATRQLLSTLAQLPQVRPDHAEQCQALFTNLLQLRQVHGLVDAAKRMSKGDLTARSGFEPGPGELGQLARSFDEMAASLETHVADLERAQADLRALNDQLEQRVLERTLELRRSNEDLEQFACVASHDLQEPLRMITSYIALLRQREEGNLDQNSQQSGFNFT